MTENMTEQTTNPGRCIYGAGTDTPCARPAVDPLRYELPESFLDDVGGVCAFHRAMEPMWEELDEVAIALETVGAWKKAAERRGNRYLLHITLQADADLSERLEFLEGNLERIKKADMGQRTNQLQEEQRMMAEETIDITPHVIARGQDERLELVEVRRKGIKALPVFRNELDAMRFMADSDHNPYDGFRPVPMDHETIAGVLALLDFSHVALSEEWTGTNGVDLFEGDVFVKMLEDSLQEA